MVSGPWLTSLTGRPSEPSNIANWFPSPWSLMVVGKLILLHWKISTYIPSKSEKVAANEIYAGSRNSRSLIFPLLSLSLSSPHFTLPNLPFLSIPCPSWSLCFYSTQHPLGSRNTLLPLSPTTPTPWPLLISVTLRNSREVGINAGKVGNIWKICRRMRGKGTDLRCVRRRGKRFVCFGLGVTEGCGCGCKLIFGFLFMYIDTSGKKIRIL